VVRTLTGYTKINYANPLGTVTNPFTPASLLCPRPPSPSISTCCHPMRRTGTLPSIRAWVSRTCPSILGPKELACRAWSKRIRNLCTGATFANSPRRRLYSGCTLTTGTCTLGTAGCGRKCEFNSTRLSLSDSARTPDLNYTLAYTYSKDLDYSSSLHMSGPAPWMSLGT